MMVAPMGAWEDGFAAGYRAGLRQDSIRFREDIEDLAKERRIRTRKPPKRKGTRKASAYSKRLGAALRRIRKRAIKKDGDFRKGWNNAKIMRLAHKEARNK